MAHTQSTVTHGPEVFRFDCKQRWINGGNNIWRFHEIRGDDALCLDAQGRICEIGAHFARAEKDNAYPIVVYRKQPEGGA